MKRHYGIVKSAKIINVVSACLMFLAGLLLLVIPNLGGFTAQRIMLSILFGLTGAAKVFGYFSNDLYRLAFQFDFATGFFCILLAILTALVPENMFHALYLLIAAYVTLDALMKAQISIDAKRFGMTRWLLILISSLLLCGAGGFYVGAVAAELMRMPAIIGIALMADGLENMWVTAYTVRVQTKKKSLPEEFDVEE